MPRLAPREIEKHLNSGSADFEITLLDEVDSTNSYIKRLEAAANNTCVIARRQTCGRGRTGNSFFSPEGGLYLSLYREIPAADFNAGLITSCVAVAVANAIDSVCGTDCKIKWVNDIFLNGKKLCGILCEAIYKNGIFGCIIGVGINVAETELSAELENIVTSLEAEGCSCDINALCAALLASLDYELANRESREFLKESRRRSAVLGKAVTVETDGVCRRATAESIDNDGRLIVKCAESTQALEYGQVHIRFER